MTTSTLTELLMSSIFVVVVFATCADRLRHPSRLTMCDLGLLNIAAFWGLTPWVSFYYGGYRLPTADTSNLIDAYVAVWLSGFGFWLAAHFLPTRMTRLSGWFDAFRRVPWQPVVLLAMGLWGVRFFRAVEYGIWSTGTGSQDRIAAQPYIVQILVSVMGFLTPGVTAWGAATFWQPHQSRTPRYAALATLLLELAWAFLQGRRPMLLWFILVVLAYWASGRRIRRRELTGLVCAAAFFFLVVFPFSKQFRTLASSSRWIEVTVAGQKTVNPLSAEDPGETSFSEVAGEQTDENAAEQSVYVARATAEIFGETVRQFIGMKSDPIAAEKEKKDYRENMAVRTLGYRIFVLEIGKARSRKAPMWGEALLATFVWSIPSIVFPGKTDLFGDEKHAIIVHYGLMDDDKTATWVSLGYADFGLFGALIYGAFFCFGLIALVLTARSLAATRPLTSGLVSGAALMIACTVEEDSAFLWGTLQCAVIVVLCDFALAALLGSVRAPRPRTAQPSAEAVRPAETAEPDDAQ